MKNRPLISVIIPIFNIEKYVRRCIESVMAQTYSNIEIILVDDGSTDKSGCICDEFASIDSRIIVIHKENGGLVSARKAGMKVAKGEYIGNVDGDDWIDSCMYETLMYSIGNADIIHSGYWTENSEYVPFEQCIISGKEKMELLINNYIAGGTQNTLTSSIWSKLFKIGIFKSSYESIPESQSYGEDMLCVLRALLQSDKIVLFPKAFYHYNVRSDSLSHSVTRNNIKQEINLYNCMCSVINNENVYDKYSDSLDRFLIRHITIGMKKNVNPFFIEQYNFPQIRLLEGKKIIIYGAGVVGMNYYSQMSRNASIYICGWVDRNYQGSIQSIEIKSIESILNIEYDYIVIAVMNKKIADDITNYLISIGIRKDKILWYEPKDFLE